MYENINIQNTSKSSIAHKFFERNLNNDLSDLSYYLMTQYEKIESGQILKNNDDQKTAWDSSGSITTSKWNKYNVFQFYHPAIHKLFRSVRSMTIEACEHYGINFEQEDFWVQGWFNVNYTHGGKLDWHEHGGEGAPWFHGYYSVNAEPSSTHYKVFNENVTIENKNNRAILSETGHPHSMGDWDWNGPRITVAYDVIPFRGIMHEWEQHWIPLA